jgi:hypothetical protein
MGLVSDCSSNLRMVLKICHQLELLVANLLDHDWRVSYTCLMKDFFVIIFHAVLHYRCMYTLQSIISCVFFLFL